jgi:protein tyrosine phosphatase (PTP) superfamily phosphohydrolase (DUF442 family)
MTTQDIRNVLRIDDHTLTGAQPSEDQLRAVAEAGVRVVINLATTDPRYSLADEGALVEALGMRYHHLPVAWDSPQPADFYAFAGLMDHIGGQHVFVHCAANFRVTAFYGLYAMKSLGWTEAEADALRAKVWGQHQYPGWEAFIAAMKQEIDPPTGLSKAGE